jgi:hypothetical protein
MFNNSLDKKPIFNRPDGIGVKDLTVSMFDMGANNYVSYQAYKVPKEFEMRPDLIAGAVYNNTLYAEFILKYNGISNPFTIQEGDLILIPALETMKTITSNKSATAPSGGNAIRDTYKYIDPLKFPKVNTKFQNRQIVSVPNGALPPNIAKEGENQIAYRNGRVYFGESTTTCLTSGMSQSEYLTTIIKNKK